jgi:signal transduction histidine kinase/ActR/RegA family two-component response regulator
MPRWAESESRIRAAPSREGRGVPLEKPSQQASLGYNFGFFRQAFFVTQRPTSKIVLTPSRIALLYVFISLVWIVVSSELLLLEFRHPVTITALEIVKGIAFVALTGGLLYVICHRAMVRLLRQQELLRRSEEERAELQAQLMQAQKLEGIGRLAGGVAHDFNNILTVIISSCHLLRKDVEQEEAQARVQMIETAADRAASITRQLLAFSRHQVIEIESLNLNIVIQDTSKLLGRLLGEDVRLVLKLEPNLGNVMADAGQMTQVLMNLLVNARDAMPRGGTVEIRTANVAASRVNRGALPGKPAGDLVELSVRDDGEGIPLEIQEKIFDPFFTTKEAGKGTGLGLSTVHGIVYQSGGTIDLQSAPSRGTTFHMYFPRVALAASEKTPASTAPSGGGNETILVVDDDALVVQSVSNYLNRMGYKTLNAHGTAHALDLSRNYDAKIDLLLTDLVMPEMTGPELQRQILTWRPLIRTLYMTGYASDRVPKGTVDPKRLVRKPFTADALATSVRHALDKDEDSATAIPWRSA